MKLGQLIEYNKRNILFKNYTENEAGALVPDLFIFKKCSMYLAICVLEVFVDQAVTS